MFQPSRWRIRVEKGEEPGEDRGMVRVVIQKKQTHQSPGRQVDDNVILAAYSTSSTPSLVRDLKISKLYPSSSNPTSCLTLVRQAVLGHSYIFVPRFFNSRQRVLELMLVIMHLRGDLVRICEVRIVLQNFQEGLGLA